MLSEATETINIENTITSLVGKAGGGEETMEDVTLPSLPDATQTINIEKSQTVELNPDLEDLLHEAGTPHVSDSIKFSRDHPEDDTVSELGMRGMTSHELQNNHEVRKGLERILESTPPQPVDLTLDEIMAEAGVNFGQMARSESDTVTNAIDIALKASSASVVNEETVKILSQIVGQIEANEFDVDAEYASIVEDNEDLLRILQERLRATGDTSGLKTQLNERLQQLNAEFDKEWGEWLCQVAEVYQQELEGVIMPVLEEEKASISDKASMIDNLREQVALPMLIKSAKRETKKNFSRAKAEVASCQDEVSELQAELEEAERQLEKLQSSHQEIAQLSKSVECSHDLHCKEKENLQAADSSYFKFFSVEKLHNWVLTGSSDSSLSLVFRNSSSPFLTLSFSITDTLVVTLDAAMEQVPRSANAFLSESKKKRFHPAVSGFLSNKMSLLCEDLKSIKMLSPSEIPSVIHFAELRAARIEEAAKEINTILNRCRDSFLQPSDTLKHEYHFTAFLKNSSSRKRDRLRVTLSIPDCYPFAPLDVHLQSSSNQFDTDSMNRKLRKIAKPGFGSLTRVIDAVHALVG
jgi:ubiquinone biosynthesis protein UbiJ